MTNFTPKQQAVFDMIVDGVSIQQVKKAMRCEMKKEMMTMKQYQDLAYAEFPLRFREYMKCDSGKAFMRHATESNCLYASEDMIEMIELTGLDKVLQDKYIAVALDQKIKGSQLLVKNKRLKITVTVGTFAKCLRKFRKYKKELAKMGKFAGVVY